LVSKKERGGGGQGGRREELLGDTKTSAKQVAWGRRSLSRINIGEKKEKNNKKGKTNPATSRRNKKNHVHRGRGKSTGKADGTGKAKKRVREGTLAEKRGEGKFRQRAPKTQKRAGLENTKNKKTKKTKKKKKHQAPKNWKKEPAHPKEEFIAGREREHQKITQSRGAGKEQGGRTTGSLT